MTKKKTKLTKDKLFTAFEEILTGILIKPIESGKLTKTQAKLINTQFATAFTLFDKHNIHLTLVAVPTRKIKRKK